MKITACKIENIFIKFNVLSIISVGYNSTLGNLSQCMPIVMTTNIRYLKICTLDKQNSVGNNLIQR